MIHKILGSVEVEDCNVMFEMKRLNQRFGTLNPRLDQFNSYRPGGGAMRQVTMVMLLVSIFILIMQCSENDPLSSFNGDMETVSAPITKVYPFAPYIYSMRTDSIRWLNEFPSGGVSRVSVILSGQIQTDSTDTVGNPIDIGIGQSHLDLGVETYTSSVPGIMHLAFDSVGGFLDTVPIAASPLSGLILPQNGRLFVMRSYDSLDDYTFDTIQIVNPHAEEGLR
jgi:hypothetical protein